jgi:hypothetical protein
MICCSIMFGMICIHPPLSTFMTNTLTKKCILHIYAWQKAAVYKHTYINNSNCDMLGCDTGNHVGGYQCFREASSLYLHCRSEWRWNEGTVKGNKKTCQSEHGPTKNVVVLWLCLLSLALGSDLPAFLFQHAL